MKNLIALLFALTCSTAYAQDLCTTFQPGPGQSCKDIDPSGEFDATYCEWFVDSHGVPDPIENDRVEFEVHAVNFSGYHTHGFSVFNANQRPPVLLKVNGQVGLTGSGLTATNGCITAHVFMNGFSGTYILSAASITAVAEGYPADTLTIGAHDRGSITKWANFTGLTPLPPSQYMVPQQDAFYDQLHTGPACNNNGLCNFFIRGGISGRVLHLAQSFYNISGQQLSVMRASGPLGGINDTDRGESLNALGGNWINSVRSPFEWHTIGDEFDVGNPSIITGEIMGVRMRQLEQAMNVVGCSLGKITPEGNGPANVAFWEGRKNVHMACGRSILDLPPLQ